MSKQVKTNLEVAVEVLTAGLQNGDYFARTSPKDFDAEGFFAGFQDQRKARSIWSSSVIPRLIASNHGELRKIGLSLQKKWASKSYRKQLDKARAHVEAVLESVHKHQAKVLDHSYKDLCHTLEAREASLSLTQEPSDPAKDDQDGDNSTETPGLDETSTPSTVVAAKRVRENHETEDLDQQAIPSESAEGMENPQADTFSQSDRDVFSATYLGIEHKTRLPSGKMAEDILFVAGITRMKHDLIHSFIIDVDDESVRSLFEPSDWSFIVKEHEESVELTDRDVKDTLDRLQDANSVSSLMDILNQRHLRIGKEYRMEHDYELKWLFDSVSKWIDMYTMPFPVFSSDAPLEYFWRTQAWGVLDSLFFDVPDILMVGGESQGLESMIRRNSQQVSRASARKLGGSKSDGYLRSFGASKADLMSVEGGKNWDPFAKKYRSEAGWKLGRQLHDIFRTRTEGQDAVWRKQLKTYGIIFGGATVQIHVLNCMGGAATILRRRPPLTLASTVSNFHDNAVILEVLLLLKKDILGGNMQEE
ncbi:hypothetical protein BGW39_005967 [Mortierella sp. 14UC]|nr:hypothetical protein BGW39_005967 [Mortierella sp. 14UC]